MGVFPRFSLFLKVSVFFREYINTLLSAEGVTEIHWQILSIGEIEAIQLYVGAGISLTQILDDLKHKSFNNVIENLSTQTNRNFAHSFLYDKQEELYKRLGIPEEKHPGKGNADKQV